MSKAYIIWTNRQKVYQQGQIYFKKQKLKLVRLYTKQFPFNYFEQTKQKKAR